jgi:hypothetical protein
MKVNAKDKHFKIPIRYVPKKLSNKDKEKQIQRFSGEYYV